MDCIKAIQEKLSPKIKLRDQSLLAGWNSPTASNSGRRHQGTTTTGISPNGQKVSTDLSSQIHLVLQNTIPARLTASGELLTGSSAGMENGGQLNPELSRWLMSYPPEWDACGVMAMQSLPRRRKRS
jgi:hypothetical protein